MKSHNEFIKEVDKANHFSAKIEKALSPEETIKEVRSKFGSRSK